MGESAIARTSLRMIWKRKNANDMTACSQRNDWHTSKRLHLSSSPRRHFTLARAYYSFIVSSFNIQQLLSTRQADSTFSKNVLSNCESFDIYRMLLFVQILFFSGEFQILMAFYCTSSSHPLVNKSSMLCLGERECASNQCVAAFRGTFLRSDALAELKFAWT